MVLLLKPALILSASAAFGLTAAPACFSFYEESNGWDGTEISRKFCFEGLTTSGHEVPQPLRLVACTCLPGAYLGKTVASVMKFTEPTPQ